VSKGISTALDVEAEVEQSSSIGASTDVKIISDDDASL
jgi:hypothetical protein